MAHEELFDLAKEEGRTHLGNLQDGTPVFSKLGSDHLVNHQDVIPFLETAFEQTNPNEFNGPNLAKQIEFGRLLGVSTCVETSDEDEVLYARKKGRKFGCSRFVKNREGIPCESVVLILFRNPQGLTAFMTAYIGTLSPADPCTKSAWGQEEKCIAFWKSHALIWDGNVEDEKLSEKDFFTPPSRD